MSAHDARGQMTEKLTVDRESWEQAWKEARLRGMKTGRGTHDGWG